MIKKHLLEFVDLRLIVILVVITTLCAILTLLISDKIDDFAQQYKKKFYGYILSFIVIYILILFIGYTKRFEDLRGELIFYQTASLLLGILHAWLYRIFFEEFKKKTLLTEVLFAFLVPLYSSILFIVVYTLLNGIHFIFLMTTHFIAFVVPTGIYIVFCFMMLIPPKKFITWTPEKAYEPIKSSEMENILLIAFLIKKDLNANKYITIRVKTPAEVQFGRLFFLAVTGYNRDNEHTIELETPEGKDYNWVFCLQRKWYQTPQYLNALDNVAVNNITENAVIICEREMEKNALPEEIKKTDEKEYGMDSRNQDAEQKKIDELKEPEPEGPIL